VIKGEIADRPAIALWRHFPVDDQDAETFAEASIRFQEVYDFDLLKITPASSYCLRSWGIQDEWKGNIYGTRDYTKRVILEPEDWGRLTLLRPNEGQLGMILEALKRVVQSSQGEYPILHTIFNPLAQAKNLAGNARLLEHLRTTPESVLKGLETITQTTIQFIEAIKEAGVDGIFYAIQHASYHYFDDSSYQRFGETFDRRVMAVTEDFWLNMVHLHGESIMFDLASRLPCQVVNWHDRETGPSLSEARTIFSRGLCGGLRRWHSLVLGSPKQVNAEARMAIESLDGRGFMLGAGCVTPLIAPSSNIFAAKDALISHSQ
jgi:uroporphyrinogen decarboxylase